MAKRDRHDVSDFEAMKWDRLMYAASALRDSGELLGSAMGHLNWLVLLRFYEHLNADDLVSLVAGMGALQIGLGLER